MFVSWKKRPTCFQLQWQIYSHRVLFAHLSAAYLLILCAITFFPQLLWVWCNHQSFWSKFETPEHKQMFTVWTKLFILFALEWSGSFLHLWELNYKIANSSEAKNPHHSPRTAHRNSTLWLWSNVINYSIL